MPIVSSLTHAWDRNVDADEYVPGLTDDGGVIVFTAERRRRTVVLTRTGWEPGRSVFMVSLSNPVEFVSSGLVEIEDNDNAPDAAYAIVQYVAEGRWVVSRD